MGKRALILTGNLVQDHEYVYPYYRVQEEGYELDVAVRDKKQVNGIIGVKVIPNKDVPDLSVDDYELLVLPGGAKAMEYMRQDEEILQFIRDFNSAGKTIAGICHAAQLLISARIIAGKNIAGYYSIKDDINNAGARYTDLPVVIDGNIVTTAHYKDLGPWMRGALKVASGTI